MSLKEKLSLAGGIVARRAQMYGSGNSPFAGLHDETKEVLGLNNEGAMGIAGMATSFIALAIIIAIGVIILSSVESAMPSVAENSSYYALQNTIESSTVAGYSLIAIVIIIVAAAAIMAAVGAIGGGRE